MKFINKSFEKNIDNVIHQMFPNLIKEHKTLIKNYTLEIIEYISCRFCFDVSNNKKLYYDQFYQNDFRDIKSVINLSKPSFEL